MTSFAHRIFSKPAGAAPAVGGRPGPHAVQGWIADHTTRDALARFLERKGELRRNEALLCALWWLERQPIASVETAPIGSAADDDAIIDGRGEGAPTARQVTRWVSASEVTARFDSRHFDHALSSTASMLRRAVACGLAEVEGRGWFRTTPLGAAVCEALPDRRAAAALRGVRVTLPRGKRRLAVDAG